jgi:hypothetical protein
VGNKLIQSIKKSIPYVAAIGTGPAGGYGGYRLGSMVQKLRDNEEEKLYNLSERNGFMKTSELLDSVYENAFTNELEKIGGTKEMAAKVLPWAKNMLGKGKEVVMKGYAGAAGGVKGLGKQYANIAKEVPEALKKTRHETMHGQAWMAPKIPLSRKANIKETLKDLGAIAGKNKAALITTGAGTLGLGGGGLALANGMRKKED